MLKTETYTGSLEMVFAKGINLSNVTKKLTLNRARNCLEKLMAGLSDWANFVFLGNFFKNFQTSSAGVFVAKCTDLKKQCWPMVKNLPRNNQFFGFFCPEKIKYYPEKKLPKFLKNLPSHRV